MPYVQRSPTQSFSIDWNKAVAWAESQGIGPSSYLPVYHLDLQRLQSGSYPMSAGERNRAILAAHNPNTVTPASTPRHPQHPTSLLSNLMSTAKGIFTGLIHLPQQLWHSADATVHAIEHPASLTSRNPLATVGNWLDTTLLSFLPGAADVGTLLRTGPSTLASHPISSVLDVLPGSVFKKLAARGVVDEGTHSAIGSIVSKVLPKKPGITMGGRTVENLSLGQRIERFAAKLGPGGAGVGRTLSQLGAYAQHAFAMGSNLYDYLFDPSSRILSQLSPEEFDQLRQVLDMRQAEPGDSVARAMADPALSPKVKEALRSTLDGPVRFATEESIFSGGLHAVPGVTEFAGTRTLSGDVHYYAKPRIKAIETARLARDATQRQATEALSSLEGHAQEIAALDAMRGEAIDHFGARIAAARQAIGESPELLDNVTQEVARRRRLDPKMRGIQKFAQAEAVFGEGALADDMLEQLRTTGDPAQVKALVGAMRERLRAWGPKSVAAAEVPAFAAVHPALDALEAWAKRYEDNARAIYEEIHGSLEAQRHAKAEMKEYHAQLRKTLQERHRVERQNRVEGYRAKANRAASDYARRVSDIKANLAARVDMIERRWEDVATPMPSAQVGREIMPQVRGEIAQANYDAVTALRSAKAEFTLRERLRKAENQRDIARLTHKQHMERVELGKRVAEVKGGQGDLVRELSGWAKAVDGYRNAIFDHPATEFRDAMLVLFHRHLLAHEHSATLVAQTERYVSETERRDRVAETLSRMRSTPGHLAELLTFHFHDIFDDPRLAPEVAAQAEQAMTEAWRSGFDELQTLVSQKGMRIAYIPTSTSSDLYLSRDAIRPVIRRGIPKPDVEKAKVWDFTPQTHDFAVGVNKAVVQSLQRDSLIYLMEHFLRPRALDDAELRQFVTHLAGPGIEEGTGNIDQRFEDFARGRLGMTPVKPNDLFDGVSFGSRGTERLWLPTPIVKALGQLERQRSLPILGAGLRLFRYSILGLSPRYTAHILFGGTTMLAFRSSFRAFNPALIADAWRAVRDGTLPLLPGRHAVEEGYPEIAFRQFGEAAGRWAGNEMVKEHLETVQGLKRGMAKPLHVLRAIGDINFRFTRHVRDLQGAIAYLDAATRAGGRDLDKIEVTSPETGRMVTMTKRRAMEAGMRHVEQVYGNLGAMSPFERNVMTTIFPFYGWQRHIMAYVLSFPVDHPWRALVLSQAGMHASDSVPAAWPIRLQFLMFLGSPGATGTQKAVDLRSLDPFRTVGNYFSITGVMQSLNPAITAIPSMIDPTLVYGENTLYPQLSYTAFYGIDVAKPTGNLMTAASQFTPQLSGFTSIMAKLEGVKSIWTTNPAAGAKQLYSDFNIPFLTPAVSLPQQAARTEAARYEASKTAATQAFRSGTFKSIQGLRSVPTPLNPDYTTTPAVLEALYNAARRQNPNAAPIDWLLPRPTPTGF